MPIGPAHWFGTPAYWIEQCKMRPTPRSYRLGEDLIEEVAACLLGGHGIPAEVGLAAFGRLRRLGLLGIDPPAPEAELLAALSESLQVGRAQVRYRFARQRSKRLATCLCRLSQCDLSSDPLELRDSLLQLPGIGPKTASWIVRNHLASDQVAIIDIHVFRAGMAAGLFDPEWKLPRDYAKCETAFLCFAEASGVSAAALDACIWEQMHELGPLADRIIRNVNRSRLAGWIDEARPSSPVQLRLSPAGL